MKNESLFFPKKGIFSPSHLFRNKGELVCGIDLDDCLADSISTWISFFNENIDEVLKKSKEEKFEWAKTFYVNLWTLKKDVPYYYYRLLKEMYRQSEAKKNIPVKNGAKRLTSFLKDRGYKIIIITKRRPNPAKLTYEWLEKNEIIYDDVIFSQDKHVEILTKFPNLAFMIEDNREIAEIVNQWGYFVFLMKNEYNSGIKKERMLEVESLNNILEYLKEKEGEEK